MAQKKQFLANIKKLRKRYHWPFQAKVWSVVTRQHIEQVSYSNPVKTREAL